MGSLRAGRMHVQPARLLAPGRGCLLLVLCRSALRRSWVFASLHLHAAPQYVVPSHAVRQPAKAILGPLAGGFMQDLASELPRIRLPRTSVNGGKKVKGRKRHLLVDTEG